MRVKAYAARNAKSKMEPYQFDRREPTEHDVEFKVLYCGICHSDIHTIHSDWGPTKYPSVPGHEIAGIVTRVGEAVTKFKVGDRVGVGCMVNSCGRCASCKEGLQQYCEVSMVGTYNGIDPIDGEVTKGGYSTYEVAQDDFVMAIPDELDLEHAAPLLCAGITMYSPLRHWKVGPGKKVGIVGLGGLGHMGLKYAHALGAEVKLITTSPSKAEKAKEYGADDIVVSTDEADMERHASYFDVIIDTVPVGHDVQPYIDLLARDGTVVLVGPISPMEGFHGASLIGDRRSVAGSVIGGIPETVDMLEFSAKHHIVPEIEVIPIEQVNEAHEAMMDKSMSHRYVIDLEASFKK
jgi:alcohol dehydrogenase (NADP+)